METVFKVIISFSLVAVLIGIGGLFTVGNEKLQILFKSLLGVDIVLGILYILYILWNI